jgi:MFS family permease
MDAALTPAESLDRARLTRLCATTLLHFIGSGMYMSALPLFVAFELNGSRALVGVAVGAFFPAAVLSRPFIGSGLDSWGRRPFMLAATGVMIVTSLLFMVADTVWMVIALRFIQGFAGAAYYTGAATVATDIGPSSRRAEVIALFSLFLYGGFAIGPAIGEWIAEQLSYDLVWMGAATVAAVSFFLAAGLPETLTDEARSDEPRHGQRFGIHRAALAPGAVLLCAASGYTAILAFSPLYARAIGMGASGGLYATFSITILAFRLLTRKLADRYDRLGIAFPGLAATALGLMLLALVQTPIAAYAGVATYGIGFALLFPALMAFVADRVSDSQKGAALATFTMFFDFGSGIGTYVVGLLADEFGFTAAFGLPALMCFVASMAVAAALWHRGTYAKTR